MNITTNSMTLGTRQNLLVEGRKQLILFYSTRSNKAGALCNNYASASRQQATIRQPASHQRVTIKQQQMTIKQQQNKRNHFCYFIIIVIVIIIVQCLHLPLLRIMMILVVHLTHQMMKRMITGKYFFTLSFVYFV